MIINDLDGYYIVFDTKNWNTELDTLVKNSYILLYYHVLCIIFRTFAARKILQSFEKL